ncbi:MAG: hypothetical protein P8L44_24585 [Opitutales bacterium]|nr:hypothetical protein [Opitutales bacterium]
MKKHVHSELLDRMRHSRLLNHHIENHKLRDWDMDAASPQVVIDRFFEAKRSVVPQNTQFTYFQEFQSMEEINEMMVGSFIHGHRSIKDPDLESPNLDRYVLKKEGGAWKFYWCQSVQIHIDLTWNPIEN